MFSHVAIQLSRMSQLMALKVLEASPVRLMKDSNRGESMYSMSANQRKSVSIESARH